MQQISTILEPKIKIMNPELIEIKDTLKELTATLQAYVLSEKNDDEKKMIVQSVAVSLDKIAKAVPQMKQVNSSAEFVSNFLESIKGDNGENGPQGEKGEHGDTGEQGPQGEVGPEGPIGPQGLKGDKGEKGDKGDKGDRGDDGKNGENGKTGEKGKDGSPDSALQIRDKIRSLKDKEKLSIDDLKDVPDYSRLVAKAREGIQDPGVSIFENSDEVAALIRKINFSGTGVSVTKVGDQVLVQITGGGSSNTAVQETPSGAVDGVNTVYTLSHTPVAGTLQLFMNEGFVSPSRYVLVGNEITMTDPFDATLNGLPLDALYEYA